MEFRVHIPIEDSMVGAEVAHILREIATYFEDNYDRIEMPSPSHKVLDKLGQPVGRWLIAPGKSRETRR